MATTSTLTREHASRFTRLALNGIAREYPHKPEHVMNRAADVLGPRDLHPAFYGCFDWHSAVHGHWMLVRLLRLFPGLPEEEEARAAMDENLTAANLQAEAAYFHQPNRQSFERMYGWAWLLKLTEELASWDDADGRRWSENLKPLSETVVARYMSFLPRQTYPIRTGVHPNTAFALALALDFARSRALHELEVLIIERAKTYFLADTSYPAQWEPGGEDFLSPCLAEADLMRRILQPHDFADWFHAFLPSLAQNQPPSLLHPAIVADRSDPKLVHLDGLNLSRGWCMRGILEALPEDCAQRSQLMASAHCHEQAGLAHVASGDYVGEHWLASFAVYLLTGAGIG
jgi:hypothetical protein